MALMMEIGFPYKIGTGRATRGCNSVYVISGEATADIPGKLKRLSPRSTRKRQTI
jgi:hypothetical protein